MLQPDPYFKLRAPAPTPLDELCRCPGRPPIKLMPALSANPVHCMNCNLEVAPETLALDVPLVECIATWTSLYDAIYRLWLDSADYEAWAKRELSGLSSAVTTRGRSVQRALNDVCRCYFWYFQDQAADTFRPLTDCPSCQQPLRTYTMGIFRQSICEDCSLVIVGE